MIRTVSLKREKKKMYAYSCFIKEREINFFFFFKKGGGCGMHIAIGYSSMGQKKMHKKKKMGLVGDIFNLKKQRFYFVSLATLPRYSFSFLIFF
jgi:hypothetical protein